MNAIPKGALVSVVEVENGARIVMNGDIVKDHDGSCWKFLRIQEHETVEGCQVVARHAVSGKLVTTTPAAFNLRIVWEDGE